MADTANAQMLTEQASGSVGGVTFSHNQHGPYTRARSTPADPGSAQQLAVRAALSQCVTAWNTTLTQPEREAWERYALALRQPSPIGRQTNVGGLGMYVRSNVPRIQAAEASLPRVDIAPSLFDLGPHTPITRVVLNIVSDTLHVFFDESDTWHRESGAAFLFYASTPQLLTRTFWKGPYRYAGPIIGKVLGPPDSPATIPLPFPAAINERVFARYRLTRADGRLSSSIRLPADYLPQLAPLPVSVAFVFVFPTLVLDIAFDHLLEGFVLATAPWSVQFGNFVWTIGSARARDDTVRLLCTANFFNFAPNDVTYAPPPADVIALLTSIPAVGFSLPIPFP